MTNIQYRSVRDYAEEWGVVPLTVRRWIELGLLPGVVRIGGIYKLPVGLTAPVIERGRKAS